MTALSPSIGVLIQNDSGEPIPPQSIVVVTSVEIVPATANNDAFAVHHVDQFSSQPGNILVTGQSWIDESNKGRAFNDQLIYASIDRGVAAPKVGEQWGPVASAWTISRGGMGFYCQGFDSTNGAANRAIFRRDRGWSYGKLASSLAAGSVSSPTTCPVNIWHPDPASTSVPRPLIQASATGLSNVICKNYMPGLSGSSGFLCKIEWDFDMPSFYWVDCPT